MPVSVLSRRQQQLHDGHARCALPCGGLWRHFDPVSIRAGSAANNRATISTWPTLIKLFLPSLTFDEVVTAFKGA